MLITDCQPEHVAEAAVLFTNRYKLQREAVPVLPARMGDVDHVANRLRELLRVSAGVVAVENGRLLGYLAWFLVPDFRGTPRLGAYVPEWGHAAAGRDRAAVYRALYRAAAGRWSAASCQVHALTMLPHDEEAKNIWFWQGFGLTVVDAVRPVYPLAPPPLQGKLHVRQATVEDVPALTAVDAEHWQHYSRPPILMPPHTGLDEAGNVAFLSRPRNSVWLAYDGRQLAGFLRCDGCDFDGVEIVQSDQTVAITGAYVRPGYRGQGAAAGLLDAALRHYQALGFARCALNFESFNPEAAAFWLRYFAPVCYSLLRVPES
ncbi:MAG: GNAT family N-acetyltransferase [Ardenticatenaceae bacterium]|nr:GNAT family N-acetyltransferase [Ardenticatenaceae bacterium]